MILRTYELDGVEMTGAFDDESHWASFCQRQTYWSQGAWKHRNIVVLESKQMPEGWRPV